MKKILLHTITNSLKINYWKNKIVCFRNARWSWPADHGFTGSPSLCQEQNMKCSFFIITSHSQNIILIYCKIPPTPNVVIETHKTFFIVFGASCIILPVRFDCCIYQESNMISNKIIIFNFRNLTITSDLDSILKL